MKIRRYAVALLTITLLAVPVTLSAAPKRDSGPPSASAKEAAASILKSTKDLSQQASRNKLDMLAYLLDMAAREADDIVNNRRNK